MSRPSNYPPRNNSRRSSCIRKDMLFNNNNHNDHQQPDTKTQCGFCTTFCVFCEIWKLVTLLRARMHMHMHMHDKRPSSSSHSSRRSTVYVSDKFDGKSPVSLVDEYEYTSEHALDALYLLRKPRLASLLSLCTLERGEGEGRWHAGREREGQTAAREVGSYSVQRVR